MTINRAFPLPVFLLLFALSACDGAVPRADERQPSHPAVVNTPVPLPPRAPAYVAHPTVQALPPAQPQADWRDVALPAGSWTWSAARPGTSAAVFAAAGQAPLAILQCERMTGVVRIALPIDPALPPGPAARTATITASTSAGTVTAEPMVIDGRAMLAITLPASNRLLDAMAFSRGRFRLEIAGMPSVVLPSWSEVGRVVEDCRG